MITFMIVVGCILSYAVVGAFVGARIQIRHEIKSGHTYKFCDSSRSGCDAALGALIAGVIWPIALPVLFGVTLGRSNKEVRSQRKQDLEIEKARHEKRLAQIKRDTLELLEKEAGLV